MSVERYAIIRLKRGRKKGVLVGEGGQLLSAKRDVDAAISRAFQSGWTSAVIEYVYADNDTASLPTLVIDTP